MDNVDNIPRDIADGWKDAIEAEMAELEINHLGTLIKLPAGSQLVDNKWMFTIKRVVERT